MSGEMAKHTSMYFTPKNTGQHLLELSPLGRLFFFISFNCGKLDFTFTNRDNEEKHSHSRVYFGNTN